MRKFCVISFLAVVLYSCAHTSVAKTPIFKDSDIEVTLYGVATPEGMAHAGDYSHPAIFKVEDLKYLLRSIGYEEKSLFGWANARAVFSADELYRLAPHLVEAFARANPGEEILFSSDVAKRGGLFSSDRLTSGRMFVRDKKLHCIFGNINVRPGGSRDSYSYDDTYDTHADPRGEYGGLFSRLVTNDWQKLVEDSKGVHYNWIEIDIDKGLAEKTARESAARRRAQRRRAIQQERQRDSVYWEDWEPDESLQAE